MKIQFKFFLVLIIFSLAPLFIVAMFGHYGNKKLGREISTDARETIAGITYDSLQASAEDAAKIILNSKTTLEFALLGLICEAEQAIIKSPPAVTKIYYAPDFDDPEKAPVDFKPASRYIKTTPDGRIVQSSVSYDHPVYLTAPGVDLQTVSSDIARLTRLDKAFKVLYKRLDHLPYWIYVSTESGIHVSYPGHGGYPAEYDPRKRPWYIAANESTNPTDMPVWSVPIVDATTGLVVFTASRQIRYPDGSTAGVAGLDILLTDVLQESDLKPVWSPKMKSMVVLSMVNPAYNKHGLRILAKKEYQQKAESWTGMIECEWLSSNDTLELENFIEQINTYPSGYMELSYDNVNSIWAYSHIADNIYFIMVVPKSIIMTLPNKMEGRIFKYIKNQHIITAMGALIAIILIAFAAYYGSNALTTSLVKIASAAKRLANGDFSVHLDMKTGDERDIVVNAFNEMVPKLKDHLRLRKALDLAQEVQQSLLPRKAPSIPGLDVAASSIYCDETGGDYYDYFNVGPEEQKRFAFAIIVGDVSGHGVSSALLMATARALLRQRASMAGQANDIITDVNRNLTIDAQETGQFMTLFYLEFDAKERVIRWVRAGHDPAILYDPRKDLFDELKGKGIALGINENYQYGQYERVIDPHQIIVIGTDGIWEMHNTDGKMFGKESLLKIIRKNASRTAQEILTSILDAVHSFRGDNEPEDDITLIVIKAIE